MVSESLYSRLELLKGKMGKNESFGSVISKLILNWAIDAPDSKYLEVRQRQIVAQLLVLAKQENLIKAITPEFQTLIYFCLSGKFAAAQSYLKTQFGGIIRSQKNNPNKKVTSKY